MIKLEVKITPNTVFGVTYDEVFENDSEILNTLYGPILGTSALGLYTQLRSLAIFQEQQGQLHTHFELQSLLNASITQLDESRKLLEACGLLKTWVSRDQQRVSYVLKRPLTVKEFFATDLLTILLLEQVGDLVFANIKKRMLPDTELPENAEDVSASVTDVFPLIVDRIKRGQPQLTAIKAQIGDIKAGPQETNERSLDEKLLLNILANSFVDTDSVKSAMELIQTEAGLYGIDEVQMGKYVLKAVNLKNNQLDGEQLKRIISNAYRNTPTATTASVADNSATQVNDKQPTTQLSGQQNQIVQIATQVTPLQFLQQIKKQKRGFVTSGEERLVRDLIGRHILPNQVINILIYHLLVDEGHATLNKSLTETIANDWSQQKITTAQQAIATLQTRKDNANKRATKTRNGRKNIKETLPEWAKSNTSSAKVATKLTPEQEKKLQERLNKLQDRK